VAKRINSRVLDTQCAGHAHIMHEDGVDVMQRANIDEDRRASPPLAPRRPHASTRVSRLPHVALHHSVCRCCIGLYRWPCHGGKESEDREDSRKETPKLSCHLQRTACIDKTHGVTAETRRVTQLNGCVTLVRRLSLSDILPSFHNLESMRWSEIITTSSSEGLLAYDKQLYR
jgi:hypothetical protein